MCIYSLAELVVRLTNINIVKTKIELSLYEKT